MFVELVWGLRVFVKVRGFWALGGMKRTFLSDLWLGEYFC